MNSCNPLYPFDDGSDPLANAVHEAELLDGNKKTFANDSDEDDDEEGYYPPPMTL